MWRRETRYQLLDWYPQKGLFKELKPVRTDCQWALAISRLSTAWFRFETGVGHWVGKRRQKTSGALLGQKYATNGGCHMHLNGEFFSHRHSRSKFMDDECDSHRLPGPEKNPPRITSTYCIYKCTHIHRHRHRHIHMHVHMYIYILYNYICIYIHCISLHCIPFHCTALHYIACITLHRVTLCCIALHCIACHCIAFHSIAFHCIPLGYIALRYMILYYILQSQSLISKTTIMEQKIKKLNTQFVWPII